MRTPLALLLALALLTQTLSHGLLMGLRAVAKQEFTELFCQNRALEPAPMCFGACVIEDSATALVDDTSGGMTEVATPDFPVYLPVANWARPPVPGKLVVSSVGLLRTVPSLLGQDYWQTIERPPA